MALSFVCFSQDNSLCCFLGGSTAATEERLPLKPPTGAANDTKPPSFILSLPNDASSSARAAFSQLPGQGELSG